MDAGVTTNLGERWCGDRQRCQPGQDGTLRGGGRRGSIGVYRLRIMRQARTIAGMLTRARRSS